MKTASLTRQESNRREAESSPCAFAYCGRQRKNALLASAAIVIALLAVLTSCSSDSGKPAEEAKPEPKGPELITARSAFQKVYVAARGWNLDAKPYRLEAVATTDGNGHDGKWAVWRGSFASATQRSEKSYTWSGSAADGAPARGINPGTEDSYSASNASTQVFDMAFLKIDSDQAEEVAQKHGGDKILEKAPDTPIIYICDWNHNTNELVWHVIYGAVREGAKLTVSVNASTGEFIRVEK
ncbi:MAG: PepSY domain-containing protein [Candidatus Sulfotelmatobacter sp.]